MNQVSSVSFIGAIPFYDVKSLSGQLKDYDFNLLLLNCELEFWQNLLIQDSKTNTSQYLWDYSYECGKRLEKIKRKIKALKFLKD